MDKAISRLVCAGALWALLAPTAWTLDSATERTVRSATFEFFAAGVTPGSKGLVATAFAIGPNEFVTAAHLFGVVIGGRFARPVLLDSNNVSHPVADILQFSQKYDYVIFSLERPPHLKPLAVQRWQAAQQPDLYFAGWRPGRSIEIDHARFAGLERDKDSNQFDLLSFSGQIWGSVGGGPLLDATGHVVGIVEARSSVGGANFAIPIELLSAETTETAHIHETEMLRALMPAVMQPTPLEAEVSLPKSFEQFSREFQQLRVEYFDRAVRPLLEATRHNFVMTGENAPEACTLLNGDACQCKPRHGLSGELVLEDKMPEDLPKRLSAGEDVSRKIAGAYLLRTHEPQEQRASRHDPAADAALHLKLALKTVAPDAASAAEDIQNEAFVDYHDRAWRIRTWSLADRDLAVISMVRRSPDGFVILTRTAPTALVYAASLQLKFVANIIYYSCDEEAESADARMAASEGARATRRPAG